MYYVIDILHVYWNMLVHHFIFSHSPPFSYTGLLHDTVADVGTSYENRYHCQILENYFSYLFAFTMG